MYLAAISILLSIKNEAADLVDLGLLVRPQYDSLVRCRDECRAAGHAVASPSQNDYKWMPDAYAGYLWFGDNVTHDIRMCKEGETIFIGNVSREQRTRRWWMDYMRQAAADLVEGQPCGSAVTRELFKNARRKASRCRG